MSGSMFSLLSNSDNAYFSRYGLSDTSDKDFKNQSNFERQNLDQSITEAFATFSRDLQRPYSTQSVPMGSSFQMNNFNRCIKTPICGACSSTKLAYTPTKITGTLRRDPNSSPKIVAVERKKNVNYQPVYMQRHSIVIDDRLSVAQIHHRNYEQNMRIVTQSKRTSMPANAVVTTPTTRTLPNVRSQNIPKPGFQSSVRDRISFFNKLANESSPNTSRAEPLKPKESFLSLLRQKEPQKSKTSIIRLSTLIAATLSATKSLKESLNGTKSAELKTTSPHLHKFSTYSLPQPMKRKLSFERTKIVSSSISKGPTSYGTNPRRHTLMEDLSMVVPVKLRIAAFEKRISTTQV